MNLDEWHSADCGGTITKTPKSETNSRSLGFPRSLDLTVIGLANVIDRGLIFAYPATLSLSSIPVISGLTSELTRDLNVALLFPGLTLLVLGLVWRPANRVPGEPGLGIHVFALYVSLSLFVAGVIVTLPSFRSGGVQPFLASVFLVIFAAIFYVLGKSLWKGSNTARITVIFLYALGVIAGLANYYFTGLVPTLLTPIALIWYLYRGHVKEVFSPPPPPEAANYVLRTRAELVKCPNCGAGNRPDAEVCVKCHAPLVSLTQAGTKPIGMASSLMIPPEEELRRVEEKLSQLQEFRKSHTLLNAESYDALIEMQKRRLEELRAMVPGGNPSKHN